MNVKGMPTQTGLSAAEAAGAWIAREDHGALNEAEIAERDAWRAASSQNEAAYRRGKMIWAALNHADEDPHLGALHSATIVQSAQWSMGRWRYAAAAVLVLCLLPLTWLLTRSGNQVVVPSQTAVSSIKANDNGIRAEVARSDKMPDQQQFASENLRLSTAATRPLRYSTKRGEQHRVRLADNSFITLNTDTEVEVAFREDRRAIWLLRGQALFEVAHDQNRPFVVVAGGRQVTAVGTVFEVQVSGRRLDVTLVEGRVAVAPVSELAVPPEAVLLSPGQNLMMQGTSPAQVASVDTRRELRWREGFVEFDNVTLADAVEEMNRYASSPIVIGDNELGKMRIGGVYRTGDSGRFLETVTKILPASIQRQSDGRISLVRSGGK